MRFSIWPVHAVCNMLNNGSLPLSIFEHSQFKILWILPTVSFEILMNSMKTIQHSVDWFFRLRIITFSRSQWSYMFLTGFVTLASKWPFPIYSQKFLPTLYMHHPLSNHMTYIIWAIFSMHRTQSMMGSLILNDAKP